ncbi:Alcohol acyl transferase 1 allele RGa [Euphorbia peplus]|nr:Alcohol acyl transferase 1 allele RGa [Euphorbia peplus]
MAEPLFSKVYRQQPELIIPAKPTPYEFKPLSDIDDHDGVRNQLPLIFLYRFHPSMRINDPFSVLKQSLAQTLVFYYPFAGRIREWPNRKLVVECNAEGILFVEAAADVSLKQLGDVIRHPFPCLDELLFDVPGSVGIVDCPLMHIQVTRLTCGAIIIATRYNHPMSDGMGILQFWSTVGEMARGACVPTVPPIWERHLLNARDPPHVTCVHELYTEFVEPNENISLADMAHQSFYFGKEEISLLRKLAPPHLGHCSSFELLTACMWRCRTIALEPSPEEEMWIICTVNARNEFKPPIPKGYYGNCFAFSGAKAKAGDLCQESIGYAVELIRKTKTNITEEYMRSLADLMVIKGRPWYSRTQRSFIVTGTGHVRFDEVDFGWGRAVYGGPAKGNLASFHIACRNEKGEDGTLVTLCLPKLAMQRFVVELDRMLKKEQPTSAPKTNFTMSSAL